MGRCLQVTGLVAKWEKQEGNPVLLSSASLLFNRSVGAMDAKVVLITGCSSGIGLSLAVRLASDPQKAFKGNQNLCCLLVPVEGGGTVQLLVTFIKCPVLFFLVYATMRNLSKKERLLESVKGLHKDTLDILQMDVTSQQSILEATARIVEKRIDVLGTLGNS